MIQITFTEAGVLELRELEKHPHHVVRRRALTLILKSNGIEHHKIAKIVGISENTVRRYFLDYQEGGVEKLKALNFYQCQSTCKNDPVEG